MDPRPTIVIVGGGIAGITCLDTLINEHDRDNPRYRSIILISESRLVKRVVNYSTRGRNLENFEVTNEDATDLYKNGDSKDLQFQFIVGHVEFINSIEKSIHVQIINNDGDASKLITHYDFLCLCNGSSPKKLDSMGVTDPHVEKLILTVRDTTSVDELRRMLFGCRKIAIIGNGGISLELVNKISNCQIVWIVRDELIGHPFLDSGASKFLLDSLQSNSTRQCSSDSTSDTPHPPSTIVRTCKKFSGPALGPHWLQGLSLEGNSPGGRKLDIVYSSTVARIDYTEEGYYPLTVYLQDSQYIECDLIISAIGVSPNHIEFTGAIPDWSTTDEGILIDAQMRTSVKDVYAAGDVVSCEKWPSSDLWFQMRLWTQARQMGYYCAKCIVAHIDREDRSIYFNFDCFTHCTVFFGKKLVLLGRYNAQSLSDDDMKSCEIIARVIRDKDYIKLLLKNNRVIGATLVGDTGLEETIENLIYDRINIGNIKEHLLDDIIDIEDFFD